MVINVSETEAYLFSENVSLRKQYNADVAHLRSEIHRLEGIVEGRDKTIAELEQKNTQIAEKALNAVDKIETLEIERSVLQSSVYILLKSMKRDYPNSSLLGLESIQMNDAKIELTRLGRILFDFISQKYPDMDPKQRIQIISQVLEISQ